MEHLSGDDDRFVGTDALSDEVFLDARDAFGGNFDAEVAACNHNAIGSVEDFVEVVDTFLVFNFGDDFD